MHSVSDRGNLRKPTVPATCASCHQQRASQVLRASHMPLGENRMECTSCHNPHGSPNEKLLKVPKPRLCQQCHDPTSHPTQPRGITAVDARFIRGRQCVDCHFNIHGSNHPSGKYFTR
jgi:predicted CXXCH cytochrome family protein